MYLDHTTSLTSPVFGIKAEQLEASDLTCNLVNDDLLNPVYKTGFQFYDCPNNRIEKSITQDIETGIAVIGNEANSEFRNNEFTNYIEGFVIGDKVNAVPTTVEYLDLLPNLKLPGNLWYGGTDETLRYAFLNDHEIGELPRVWNWLADEDGENDSAKIVHWTTGIPAFQHYADAPMADVWAAEALRVTHVAK